MTTAALANPKVGTKQQAAPQGESAAVSSPKQSWRSLLDEGKAPVHTIIAAARGSENANAVFECAAELLPRLAVKYTSSWFDVASVFYAVYEKIDSLKKASGYKSMADWRKRTPIAANWSESTISYMLNIMRDPTARAALESGCTPDEANDIRRALASKTVDEQAKKAIRLSLAQKDSSAAVIRSRQEAGKPTPEAKEVSWEAGYTDLDSATLVMHAVVKTTRLTFAHIKRLAIKSAAIVTEYPTVTNALGEADRNLLAMLAQLSLDVREYEGEETSTEK